MNLDKVAHFAEEPSTATSSRRPASSTRERRHARSSALRRGPKTLKWKMRAKVGDRVQWYQLPEEVGH